MPPLEYGNLHKFKVSVGVILALSPIFIIWIMTQSSSILEIDRNELDGFTETAQHTIHRRQDLLDYIQGWPMWGAAGVVVLSGAFLIYSGITGWSESQSRIDESEELGVAQRRAEFGSSPEADTGKIKDHELLSEIGVEKERTFDEFGLDDQNGGDPDTATEKEKGEAEPNQWPVESESSAAGTMESAKKDASETSRRFETARANRKRSEDILSGKLIDSYGDKFKVTRNPWVEFDTNEKLRFDFLLEASESYRTYGDLAFDFRYIYYPKMTLGYWAEPMMTMSIVGMALRSGKVCSGKAGRPVDAKISSIVVYVVDDSGESKYNWERGFSRLIRRIEEANRVLKNRVGAVFFEASQLDSITSQEFMEIVTEVWSGRREIYRFKAVSEGL